MNNVTTEVSLCGTRTALYGALPAVGSSAPDFILVNSKLKNNTLKNYSGKKKLLYIVPSLDTSVCATSSKKFSELATDKPDNSVILIISSDLPFAQTRFCTELNTNSITLLSTMRSEDFAKDYGVLIMDGPLAGLTTRAVLVLDEKNNVLYSELVAEISDEPDYQRAFAALTE